MPSEERQIILLGGMHRSGTSALARVLNLLGAYLPEPLVPPGEGNEHGHWEPQAVVEMNDRALIDSGVQVNSAAPVPAEWFTSKAGRRFQDEISDYVSAINAPNNLILIKDPRISLLAKSWKDGVAATGVAPKFIISSRSPSEVADSLSSRQLRIYPHEVWPLERSAAIWLNYTISIEYYSRDMVRAFSDYSWILEDWRGEVHRITQQLYIEGRVSIDDSAASAIDEFLRPDARHSRLSNPSSLGPTIAGAYHLLVQRRDDPTGAAKDFDALRHDLFGAFNVLGEYLAELERRSAEGMVALGDAKRLEQEALALKVDGEAAQRQILHLKRKLDLAQSLQADAADSDGQVDRLRARLTALTSAHSRLVDELRQERATAAQQAHETNSHREKYESKTRQAEAEVGKMAERDLEKSHADNGKMAEQELAKNALREALDTANAELSATKQARAQLEDELLAMAALLAESEAHVAESEARLAQLETQLDEAQASLAEEEARSADLAVQIESLRGEFSALTRLLIQEREASHHNDAAQRSSISDLQAELTLVRSDKKVLVDELSISKESLEQLARDLSISSARAIESSEEAAALYEELKQEITSSARQLADLKLSLSAEHERAEAVRAELSQVLHSKSWRMILRTRKLLSPRLVLAALRVRFAGQARSS